jgi:hypothetical protein
VPASGFEAHMPLGGDNLKAKKPVLSLPQKLTGRNMQPEVDFAHIFRIQRESVSLDSLPNKTRRALVDYLVDMIHDTDLKRQPWAQLIRNMDTRGFD